MNHTIHICDGDCENLLIRELNIILDEEFPKVIIDYTIVKRVEESDTQENVPIFHVLVISDYF